MACRWSAMPWPCRALLWASPSADLTLRMRSASPFSVAATRIRWAALISFIASLTLRVGLDVGHERLEIP